MKSSNLFLSVFFVLSIIFNAYEKQELLTDNDYLKNEDKTDYAFFNDVKNNNGILEFNSKEDMRKYLTAYQSNPSFYKEFEEKIDFKSLQTLYLEIIEEQVDYDDDREKKIIDNEINISTVKNENRYCDLVEQNIANGIIEKKIYKIKGEENERIELTTSAPYYAPILNTDNLVIINDTIYQFNKNSLRMITDGDISKIEFLNNLSESDLDKKIIVATNTTKDYTNKHIVGTFIGKNGDSYHCKRIECLVYFDVWEYQTSQGLWRYYSYNIGLYSSIKRIWGWTAWNNQRIHYDLKNKFSFTYKGWATFDNKQYNGYSISPIHVAVQETWMNASEFTRLEWSAEKDDTRFWLNVCPDAEATNSYAWSILLAPH